MSPPDETARPRPEELERVDDDEWILRLVDPANVDPDAPEGDRIADADLPSNHFKPSSTNYGPSAFAEARCGLPLIRATNGKWTAHRVARFQARELRNLALGVDLRWSPQDCMAEAFRALRDGHVSLVGITKQNRRAVLAFLEKHLI